MYPGGAVSAFLNAVLGVLLLGLAASAFYGHGTGLRVAAWLRERLRATISPDLEVHDWIFALVFAALGSVALASAVMWLGRSHYFWVLSG